MSNDEDRADANTDRDLERFVEAQDRVWSAVIDELSAGRKETHWMWFVFPQLRELGQSGMARRYGIASLDEARAYAAHEILGPRLIQCLALMLEHRGESAGRMLGPIDAMKLRSCATLFAEVEPTAALCEEVLRVFFGGERCKLTGELLRSKRAAR